MAVSLPGFCQAGRLTGKDTLYRTLQNSLFRFTKNTRMMA
jgi:hypothetical protein